MPITGKKVVAAVNKAWVGIEWDGSDDNLIVTINGIVCRYNMWAPGVEPYSRDDTIAALKEAVEAL